MRRSYHRVRRRSDRAHATLFASVTRFALQQLLHDDRVHPLAVELPLLAVGPDRAEAELLVEGHAAGVEGEGGEYELVEAVLAAELDQLLEQHATGARAASAALDVHGDVGDEAIGLASVEDVEARPAGDLAVVILRDHQGLSGNPVGQPLQGLAGGR